MARRDRAAFRQPARALRAIRVRCTSVTWVPSRSTHYMAEPAHVVVDAARQICRRRRCRSCGRAATARPTRCSSSPVASSATCRQDTRRSDAVCRWVRSHVEFRVGTSTVQHVGARNARAAAWACAAISRISTIAILRSLNYPARFVTGVDYGADRIARPAGFPRVRRGVHRRSLVAVRSDGHLAADRPDPHRHGPRRRGRLVRDDVRQRHGRHAARHVRGRRRSRCRRDAAGTDDARGFDVSLTA